MTRPRRRLRLMDSALAAVLFILARAIPASALEWITLAPNPAYSRDLAMGTSTIALSYAPQSQSINPAGITLFPPRSGLHASLLLNGGGLYQSYRYLDNIPEGRSGAVSQDIARMLASCAAVQLNILTAAVCLAQPVMPPDIPSRYTLFETGTPLTQYQNSLTASLALHPRVSVGGRIDRFYTWDSPQGDAYSYGVILRPSGVDIGVQYQRFPDSSAYTWHPLDRRADDATTAGISVVRGSATFTMQVMNLTRTGGRAFLEPHAGFEWRPTRGIALRGGGMQFSRSPRWAWTGGFSLLDANWLRPRAKRLAVPDDVLQCAVGVIYHHRTPEWAMGSLTAIWRF
jgi:hypothetical protein